MIYFLWFVFIIGIWNLLNFIVRVYDRKVTYKYSYHILIGIWAGILLFN